MHPEDDNEGWYLHRKISVDDWGWHEEVDPRYGETLVKQQGLEMGHASKVPGFKQSNAETRINPSKRLKAETPIDNKLNKHDHTYFRGGAGMAQYMQDRRGDISFATKEVWRKASAPTGADDQNLKKIARYRIPRANVDSQTSKGSHVAFWTSRGVSCQNTWTYLLTPIGQAS